MSIHSKFLIHWTGHDFDNSSDIIDDSIREKYVNRLKNDLKEGFYINPGTERIDVQNNTSIAATISRVCLSEVRLSQARVHATKYGKLGIGVNREFIIERKGNPVFYIQSGDTGVIAQNCANLREFIDKNCHDQLKYFEIILAYLKNMSDTDDSKYDFYEEMEWRVTHLEELVPEYITVQDSKNYIYRLKLKAEDIRIVVFPDEETKKRALKDRYIDDFFKDYMPQIATLTDCGNF